MDARRELLDRRAASRMAAGDHTLWSPEPAEISNRLGWLDEPQRMRAHVGEVRAFADRVRDDGIRNVVWCGMGGSSLFPELLAGSNLRGNMPLAMTVLDTSHPNAMRRVADEAAAQTTLYVFASKSGGTIETRSQLEFFWAHDPDPSRFVVITDAGSSLDTLARERALRHAFHANPNIGGRYSALSHFGIVAAALLDIDLAVMLDGAVAMAELCATDTDANPGVELAALIGGRCVDGVDKLVLDCGAAFAGWLEQLIAESTGKHGTGIVPVPGTVADAVGDDRARVSYANGGDLDLGDDLVESDARALGREVMRWEVATALAGALLGINPFDQPDVEAAKVAAKAALESGHAAIEEVDLDEALSLVAPGRYLAIQAFCDPGGTVAHVLDEVRVAVRDLTGAAVTAAIGPRYLHSTGQLHKGGPTTGVFVQVVDETLLEVAIPGGSHTFGELLHAQAAGDHAALRERGRPVSRVASRSLLDLVARR